MIYAGLDVLLRDKHLSSERVSPRCGFGSGVARFARDALSGDGVTTAALATVAQLECTPRTSTLHCLIFSYF